jgi:hypothetical protein
LFLRQGATNPANISRTAEIREQMLPGALFGCFGMRVADYHEVLIRPQAPGFLMTEAPAFRRFAHIAQKWRNLVERRCVHFIELHRTGAWKYNYTEAQFLLEMREAVAMAEAWARLAPRPEDLGDETSAHVGPLADARRRTAA